MITILVETDEDEDRVRALHIAGDLYALGNYIVCRSARDLDGGRSMGRTLMDHGHGTVTYASSGVGAAESIGGGGGSSTGTDDHIKVQYGCCQAKVPGPHAPDCHFANRVGS